MTRIKSIFFKFKLKGRGIVNFDGNDGTQSRLINENEHLKHLRYFKGKNISYAKKIITENDYKIKISSDSLIYSLFSKNLVAQTPELNLNENILYSYLASSTALLRGHLFAAKGETLKRKGVISITDAIQISDGKTFLEQFSRSGSKPESNIDIDESSNTYYFKESVGEIEYEAQGALDIKALQFISCDQAFDRFSFNPDKFDMFKNYLKLTFPKFDSELGYYKYKTSSIDIPEYGLKLNDDQVLHLVKDFFRKLATLSINKRSAFANVSEIQYKAIEDATIDTFNDKNNWKSISNIDDVKSMNFKFEEFYVLEDEKIAKLKKQHLDKLKASLINIKKEATKIKKEEVAKKKEQANAKKEKLSKVK